MPTIPAISAIPGDENARRLIGRLEVVASVWLVALPMLRPLVWSGQPTDVPNLLLLVLLAAAATTGLLLRGLQVTATDPVTYIAVAALVMITAGLATWWPARQAARVDPAITLRAD